MKRFRINFSALKWLHRNLAPERGSLALLFAIKILQGVDGIAFAFCMRYVVDAAVAGDALQLRRMLILMGCLVAAAVTLYGCAVYFTEKPTAKLTKNLQQRIFRELLHRSYQKVSNVHTGQWMTLLTSDTRVVSGAVSTILPSLAGMLVQITCAFISLFLLLPKVAWLMIPCGLALMSLSLLLRVKLKEYHREVQKQEGLTYSYLQEHLSSLSVIRTYTREEYSGDEAADRMQGVVDVRLARSRFAAVCASGIYAVIRGGYYLGVIVCAAKLMHGSMSYGLMMAVLQLIRQAEAPLSDVTRAIPQFYNMLASAERLMKVEELASDYDSEAITPEEAQRFYREDLAAFGLKDASFSYVEDPERGEAVLSGLNIEVGKGQFVAFTGESGCGKSTTMTILMGLYRLDSGSVYLRDREGRTVPMGAEWRALFAYVPQENHLLSGKLRDVIAFAVPDRADDDEGIWEALRIACADGFVKELPDGLDAVLGEHGAGLSEGQMQRVSIARAIFSGRPVLMLDESTSALDADTERQLLENLRRMTDRTVVIITHRPAALKICDKQIGFVEN